MRIKFVKLSKLFPIIILFVSFIMTIGYAAVNSINFGFDGEGFAKKVDGIFITEVNYISNNNADMSSSKINSAYQTILNSKTVLSDDPDSSITYEITVYNSYSKDYMFDKVEYFLGEDSYSNDGITFELSDLSIGDIVSSGDYKTFKITFKYKNGVSESVLNSMLDFKFKIAPYVVATYDYSGSYDTFIAPENGIYKIELWGAQGGGDSKYPGGNGGYVSGMIELTKDEKLYIYVGGAGSSSEVQHTIFEGGYNGGGNSLSEFISDIGMVATGGGATDVRLYASDWDDFISLKSRIMVAAGGGGSTYYEDRYLGLGGSAGGLVGYNGTSNQNEFYGIGASQISGGLNSGVSEYKNLAGGFGFGGSYADDLGSNAGAGGSGYYGGSGGYNYRAGGGGGSSFVSGHNGCDAIIIDSTKANIMHSGQSVHYSGYKFYNTIIVDGSGYNWTTIKESKTNMPNHDGTGTITGNTGNGYAKITYMDLPTNPDAKQESGLYIADIKNIGNVAADLDNSEIKNITNTTLDSKITLSNSSSDSSITYLVKFKNNTNVNYSYLGIINNNYDNENIIIEPVDLARGDIIHSNETLEFKVTFKYKSDVNVNDVSNILNSKVTFEFKEIPVIYLGSYINGYNHKIDQNNNNINMTYVSVKEKNGQTWDANYTMNGVSNYDTSKSVWRILGYENDQLILTTTDEISSEEGRYGQPIRGKIGYTYMIEELNNVASIYGLGKFADTSMFSYNLGGTVVNSGARSITLKDVNYVPDYFKRRAYSILASSASSSKNVVWYTNPVNNIKDFKESKYTMFEYFNKGTWATLAKIDPSIVVVSTKYKELSSTDLYRSMIYQGSNGANLKYFLADRNIEVDDANNVLGRVGYGCPYIQDDAVNFGHGIYWSDGTEAGAPRTIRPVVYIKSNVIIDYNESTGIYTIRE